MTTLANEKPSKILEYFTKLIDQTERSDKADREEKLINIKLKAIRYQEKIKISNSKKLQMFKFILGGSKKKETKENRVKPNLMANVEDSMFII